MQSNNKNLQAKALYYQAISSNLWGERKRKLMRASQLYEQSGQIDQSNRCLALVGKFSEMKQKEIVENVK